MSNSSKLRLGTIAVGGVFAVGFLLMKRRHRSEKTLEIDSSLLIRAKLFDVEGTFARVGLAPTSTVTLMKGKAINDVRNRWKLIVQANPWLLGRVVDAKPNVELVFSKEVVDGAFDEDYFSVVEDDTIASLNTQVDDYSAFGQQFSHYLLNSRGEFKNEPLAKVVILPKEGTKFYLLFSLSHCVGDGHTYYRLFSMLVGATPVDSLECHRQFQCDDIQKQAMPDKHIMGSWGHVLASVRGLLSTAYYRRFGSPEKQLQANLVRVDSKKITEMKKQPKDTPFVSTNDILASWAFSQSKCLHSIMAINFRGKLAEHGEHLAGNYENVIYYRPDDVATPSLIRASLKPLHRAVTKDEAYSNWSMAIQDHALLTNWSTFFPQSSKDIDFHYPLYDYGSDFPRTTLAVVVFLERPNQLSLLLIGTPQRVELLKNCPFSV